MNCLKTWINESLSILQVHSIWTTLLAKQVESVLYLFSSWDQKGSNMSTPQFVNGCPSRDLSVVKSAHFSTKLLTTVLHLTTQKPLILTPLIVSPLPPWAGF